MTDTESSQPIETLQSQLSAFLDDELPTAEQDLFVRRLVRDPDLKQCMGRYQLLGEALRQPSRMSVANKLSKDFSARVAAALEQDGSAAARLQPAVAARRQLPSWLKPAVGMSLAASVAIATLAVVRSQSDGDTLRATADLAQTSSSMANGSESYVVPASASTPVAPIPAARLTNYVIAHSEFSSPLGHRNLMTGLLSDDKQLSDNEVKTEQVATEQ